MKKLQDELCQSEAARDTFSTKASELSKELSGLRVANNLLEQQVDSLQQEVGVAELVQQDLGHVLKLVEEGVGCGEMKVSECKSLEACYFVCECKTSRREMGHLSLERGMCVI